MITLVFVIFVSTKNLILSFFLISVYEVDLTPVRLDITVSTINHALPHSWYQETIEDNVMTHLQNQLTNIYCSSIYSLNITVSADVQVQRQMVAAIGIGPDVENDTKLIAVNIDGFILFSAPNSHDAGTGFLDSVNRAVANSFSGDELVLLLSFLYNVGIHVLSFSTNTLDDDILYTVGSLNAAVGNSSMSSEKPGNRGPTASLIIGIMAGLLAIFFVFLFFIIRRIHRDKNRLTFDYKTDCDFIDNPVVLHAKGNTHKPMEGIISTTDQCNPETWRKSMPSAIVI